MTASFITEYSVRPTIITDLILFFSRMPVLQVSYTNYCTFNLPEGVHLLKPSENNKAKYKKEIVPFSWWIKWATLHYIDADGSECEVEGDSSDGQNKYHDEGSEIFNDDTHYDTEFDWK